MKFVITSLTCFVASFSVVADDGLPRLTLIDKEADMGAMEENEIKLDTVLVKNTGSAPLQITSVFSACSCTSAHYPKDPIAPGDTAMLVVKFNAKDRVPGEFRKILRIRSGASNGNVPLIVKGRVKSNPRRPLSPYK